MAQAKAVSSTPADGLSGGAATGSIVLLPIPEPTYAAISDLAAQRGMTAAQAIAQALTDFLRKA